MGCSKTSNRSTASLHSLGSAPFKQFKPIQVVQRSTVQSFNERGERPLFGNSRSVEWRRGSIFLAATIRLSTTRECPRSPAFSSRQMTDAVVPTSFANYPGVRPASVRRAFILRATWSSARAFSRFAIRFTLVITTMENLDGVARGSAFFPSFHHAPLYDHRGFSVVRGLLRKPS